MMGRLKATTISTSSGAMKATPVEDARLFIAVRLSSQGHRPRDLSATGKVPRYARDDTSVGHRLSLKASHFLFTASPFSAHHSAFSKYWTSLFCLLVGNCQSLSLANRASRFGLGPV